MVFVVAVGGAVFFSSLIVYVLAVLSSTLALYLNRWSAPACRKIQSRFSEMDESVGRTILRILRIRTEGGCVCPEYIYFLSQKYNTRRSAVTGI